MSHFDKKHLDSYFVKWDSIKEEIESLYKRKDQQAIILMRVAIDNYTELLEYGGKELNERSGKNKYVLLPLNGDERFEFIKEKIHSHYAHVQLDALYTETRKKVARLSVMQRK